MEIKVSIVICSYNRATYISRALDSILSQSYRDFEIIIIDDASTDNTEDIVKLYIGRDSRIKYFKNPENLGIARSRRKGILMSQGKYIAMLDSDDHWLGSEKLAKQMLVLEADKGIGLIGTGIVCIDESDQDLKKDIYETDDEKIREKILAKNQFAQSSVVFRKDAYLATSGYLEKLVVCEDLDLWLAIGQKYKFANLAEPLVAYRLHSGGISKSRKREIARVTDNLIDKYKKNYPNYLRAKIKSVIRIVKSYL